jgi:hypothetical protein
MKEQQQVTGTAAAQTTRQVVRAYKVIEQYLKSARTTSPRLEDQLVNLLTDIRHLCATHEIEWRALLVRVDDWYKEEAQWDEADHKALLAGVTTTRLQE